MPEASVSAPPRLTDETVLAFDFGLKRIGVAVGERRLGSGRPLTTLTQERRYNPFFAR